MVLLSHLKHIFKTKLYIVYNLYLLLITGKQFLYKYTLLDVMRAKTIDCLTICTIYS